MTMPKGAQGPTDREPRVDMQDGRHGSVVIQRTTADGPKTVHGRLVDISRGGAKVALDCCVPFGETVALTITIPEIDFEFPVQAEVSWNRQDDGGTWLVGCCFHPSLSEEAAGRLAKSGYLERRRNPRYPIACGGTARWELSDAEQTVLMEDFSTDGFCMLCPKPGDNGQRFRLELKHNTGQTIAIAAKSQWQVRAEEGYLVGCAFLNRHDFHKLWEVAYQATPNQPLRSRVALAQSPWLLVWFAALIAVIVAYPPLIRWMTHRNSVAGEWHATDVAKTRSESVVNIRAQDHRMPPAAATKTKARRGPAQLRPPVATRDGSERQPTAEEKPPANAAQPAGTSAGSLHRMRKQLQAERSRWQAEQRRQQSALAQRAQSLANQATQLAARETAFKQDRRRWSRQLQRQRAELELARLQWLAERAVRKSKDVLRIAQAVRASPPHRPADSVPEQSARSDRHAPGAAGSLARPVAPRIHDSTVLGASSRVASPTTHRAQSTSPTAAGSLQSPATEPADPATIGAPRANTVAARSAAAEPGRAQAIVLWRRGRGRLEQHEFQRAAEAFAQAVQHDPDNPLYRYLLALAQYQAGRRPAAEQTVASAAQCEQHRPIGNWGQVMLRCQGASRLWLEQARRAARKEITKPAT